MEDWQKKSLKRWPLLMCIIIGIAYLINFLSGGSFQEVNEVSLLFGLNWRIPFSIPAWTNVFSAPIFFILTLALFYFFVRDEDLGLEEKDRYHNGFFFLTIGFLFMLLIFIFAGKQVLISCITSGAIMTGFIAGYRVKHDIKGDFFDSVDLTKTLFVLLGSVIVTAIGYNFIIAFLVLIYCVVLFIFSLVMFAMFTEFPPIVLGNFVSISRKLKKYLF